MTESPTNGELNIMIKNLDQKFGEFRTENKDQLEKLDKKMDDFIKASECNFKTFQEDASKHFASKWTEKVLITVGSAVGLTVLGAILSLVIIKK